jgi:hypothetical protein
MKTLRLPILILLAVFMTSNLQAQLIGGKKNASNGDAELEAKAAFDNGIKQGRIEARKRLKPYKYDGTKSTKYNYKTYTHAKEVEVLTIEKTDYKFCFDGNMIKSENITVEIYDKPMSGKGRILLFQKEDVGPGEFEVSLDEMNDIFRSAKAETSTLKPEIIAQMRLKKVYINYIIPAVDREMSVNTEGGDMDQTTIIQFSAIVMVVGYKFM